MDESVSNSITGKIKHFAPLFDALVKEVGLIGAAVFGCIWRYCQMQRKVCDASKETIAERCGVSERTVIRWAQVLCEKGYLEDLTPNLRNKPHTYRDTGKIKLEMQVSAVTESQTTEPDEPGPGMPESQTGMTESHPAMTESQSHSDRESDEETSKKPVRNKEETNLPANAEPSPLEPSTPGAQILFEKLKTEFKAKGRRAPRRFASLLNKEKFEAAEERLGQEELEKAIKRALEKGLCSVVKVTDWVAKWNGNRGNHRAPPGQPAEPKGFAGVRGFLERHADDG